MLHFLAGLKEGQISQILLVDEEEINKRIGVVIGYFSKYRSYPTDEPRSVKDEWIEKALLESWELPELSSGYSEELKSEILARAGKASNLQGLLRRGLKITVGVLAIALALAIVWLTNELTPPPESRPPLISTVLVTRIVEEFVQVTATPSPMVMEAAQGIEPLSVDSSREEILQRISESHRQWDTLWIDGRIIDYGPVGYTGRPKVRREQVWIDQPYSSLVLSGLAGGSVDQIWFSLNGKVYDVHPETGDPVLYDFHSTQLPVYSSFSDYIFPESLEEGWVDFGFKTVGSGESAGRRSLILESSFAEDTVRIWVDVFTGIVLRMMRFDRDSASMLNEIVVRDIYLDVEFPDNIFDRNHLPLRFGSSYHGRPFPIDETFPYDTVAQYLGHIPKLGLAPPVNYDLSVSQISFQWDQQPPTGALQNYTQWVRYPDHFGQDIPVDLFADQYHLGTLTFNPWSAACARSADGSTIALHSVTGEDEEAVTTLRWFDLRDLSNINELESKSEPINLALALSPDGGKLAFYACMENGAGINCGVFILDTANGAYEKLTSLQWVERFFWSSQGNSLVVVTSTMTQVFDVSNGQVTYSMDSGLQDNQPLEASPLNELGLELSSASQGLEACYQAPSASN